MPQDTSDLYGSSSLLETSSTNISRVFQPGSQAVPIGHNPNDRSSGLAFDFGPDGDPGHALTFGATRSGKGVNAIIPALLTYKGSVVVIDPKGENRFITGPYRSKFSRVITLDPWNEVNERYGSKVGTEDPVTRFNPLSALDPAGRDFADDVTSIADALIVHGGGSDSYWSDSARELVAGLIAAVVHATPGKGSLRDVRKLLVASAPDFAKAMEIIVRDDPDSLAALKLARFTTESRETNIIRSVAQTQTAILDSPTLMNAMETGDEPFNLAEVGTSCVSLYLVLPVDKLLTHGRWLRLVLTLAIRIISRQRTPPKPPVLFMLDEMGTIGSLSMIEQSFGLMAGLGIRLWGFLQDLAQLQRDYPQSWETFWSNASMVQVLNCGDSNTSKHISDYLGTYTVNAKTGGWTYKQVRWKPGEYDKMIARQTEFAVKGVRATLGRDFDRKPKDSRGKVTDTEWTEGQLSVGRLMELGNKERAEKGTTRDYKTEWVEDEQLASRPVLFPNEVRDSPADSSIIILPGRGNYRLKRFTYYSDPVLSGRARHDPNKPAPVIVEVRPPPPPLPAPPQSAAAEPLAPPASSSSGSSLTIPTTGDELANMGKELGKKAASAVGNFLKDRLIPPK